MNIPVLLYSEPRWHAVDSLFFYDTDTLFKYSVPLVAIDCADSDNCVVFGNYSGYQPINRLTKDGGKTWTTTLHDSLRILFDDIGNYIGIYNPSKVYDVAYPSKDLCIAVCDSGYYWMSRDNLNTWNKFKFDTQYMLSRIDFFNKNYGIITELRDIFFTTDAGINWERLRIPFKDTTNKWLIDDVCIIDEKTVYILVYDMLDTLSYLLKSFDFCKTWQCYILPTVRTSELYFLDKDKGWVGFSKQITKNSLFYTNLIYYTYDGGVTWEKQLDTLYGMKRYITQMYFTDESNGFALTQYYVLWKTTNGGKDWLNDTTTYPNSSSVKGNFSDIHPFSPNRIFGINEEARRIYLYSDDETDVTEYPKISNNTELLVFPNPLSSSGAIKYNLNEPGAVEIKLYDVLGNHLQTLFSGYRDAGFVSIDFSVEAIPTGVYYIVFKHNNYVIVEKFVKI